MRFGDWRAHIAARFMCYISVLSNSGLKQSCFTQFLFQAIPVLSNSDLKPFLLQAVPASSSCCFKRFLLSAVSAFSSFCVKQFNYDFRP